MWVFLKISVLQRGVVSTSPNPPSWRFTPRRLSTTAYSIYSQLPSSEAVPLSATWGRAMPTGFNFTCTSWVICYQATQIVETYHSLHLFLIYDNLPDIRHSLKKKIYVRPRNVRRHKGGAKSNKVHTEDPQILGVKSEKIESLGRQGARSLCTFCPNTLVKYSKFDLRNCLWITVYCLWSCKSDVESAAWCFVHPCSNDVAVCNENLSLSHAWKQ